MNLTDKRTSFWQYYLVLSPFGISISDELSLSNLCLNYHQLHKPHYNLHHVKQNRKEHNFHSCKSTHAFMNIIHTDQTDGPYFERAPKKDGSLQLPVN